jgi:hypothetical protein
MLLFLFSEKEKEKEKKNRVSVRENWTLLRNKRAVASL